jgi:hypothetical protein
MRRDFLLVLDSKQRQILELYHGLVTTSVPTGDHGYYLFCWPEWGVHLALQLDAFPLLVEARSAKRWPVERHVHGQ